MKLLSILFVSSLIFTTQAYSHGGRTDSSGGHNCSQKSIDKGLCSGYHYHEANLHDADHNIVSHVHSDKTTGGKADINSDTHHQKKSQTQT